jgi:hypothetical protein
MRSKKHSALTGLFLVLKKSIHSRVYYSFFLVVFKIVKKQTKKMIIYLL